MRGMRLLTEPTAVHETMKSKKHHENDKNKATFDKAKND